MEYLSKKLTNYIIKKGIITKDLFEIYQYGFQCFLEVSISTICSILISLFLHMLPECLFFFLLFIPIRSFSGGLHLKNYFSCFIGSCFILTSTLLAVKHIIVPLTYSFVLYAISAILILIIGPINHPNRDVDSHDNRIFIKKTHLTLLFSIFTAIIFCIFDIPRYMFLQSITFMFLCIAALIGRIIY